MDASIEDKLRWEQIESFGRLLAGFSHEMKNHLGIIRESNGLIKDIIQVDGVFKKEHSAERLQQAISTIESRVITAANALHHLSGLSHRPDTPLSYFQINELVAEESVFLERFSRLRQVEQTLEFTQGLPAIMNDPSLIQHVIYRLYVEILELLNSGNSLTILTGKSDRGVAITFRFDRISRENFEYLSQMDHHTALTKLNATLRFEENNKDQVEIKFTIPSITLEKSHPSR